MFFWKLCNQKIMFQYARQLKPRIPIQANEVEQKFEQQKQQIKGLAEKQIQHAHSISDLISLHNETKMYADVSEPILKRIHKLKISNDEFTQNQEFLISMINQKTFQLTLNLMKYYQNPQIESILLKAFQQNQLEINLDNSLRILEIIATQGSQEDLLKWVEKPEFTLNGKNLSKFYEILEMLQGRLPDKDLIVNKIEIDLHKYVHQFEYETLLYILKYRSFNQNALNEELILAIHRRVFQIELNLEQVTNLNQYMVELQYSDQAWLNLIAKQVLQNLDNNNLLIEEHKDDLQDDEIISNDKIENKENSQQNKDLEFEEFIKGFELRTEPFVLTDKERLFLKLMNQLSQVVILNDLNLIALSFFKELDVHMMQFYNHLTADEQLICLRFHAKFIETLYNEHQTDPKRYRRSSKKQLEQMNNNFYQITLQVLKELNFEQTLKLLDSASVLGVSKRKVCQKIMKIGLEGLKKIQDCKLENYKKNYALFAYYKLLQSFITKEDEILKIEEQFKEIKINTLDLQTEYAHLGVKRQEIQQIENIKSENLNSQF